ncbi:MAG: cytidine deaminase, partial [Clostridia bacterium]
MRRELDPETGCVQLGDIVISWPHAQGQAREYGHTPAREMGFLLAHGLLHLMGYDHMTEEDAQVMRAMEKKTMNQVHLTREQAPDAERMMALARTAREAAYVPYSGYAVGACLLAEDGRIFTGCNVENASYGLTQCAERNAVCKGVSEGARRFVALAIAAQGAMPYPCGACRQVLREFATLDMPVWVTCDGQQMQITL